MKFKKIWLLLFLTCVCLPAMAYIGPAAGIPIIGSVVGFFVTLFLVIVAILFWPIRKIIKKRKQKAQQDQT
ncbi:hypothetical protein ACFODZ_03280 [Marinicella sediminis]|uniref:Uncharacterized protein n=1 Tax=Marinicella sediminis TaxID=1792834 RepID=A0ABV7J8J4_9GAMM|nr:hypothetical protein [Marinicella sediminis]